MAPITTQINFYGTIYDMYLAIKLQCLSGEFVQNWCGVFWKANVKPLFGKMIASQSERWRRNGCCFFVRIPISIPFPFHSDDIIVWSLKRDSIYRIGSLCIADNVAFECLVFVFFALACAFVDFHFISVIYLDAVVFLLVLADILWHLLLAYKRTHNFMHSSPKRLMTNNGRLGYFIFVHKKPLPMPDNSGRMLDSSSSHPWLVAMASVSCACTKMLRKLFIFISVTQYHSGEDADHRCYCRSIGLATEAQCNLFIQPCVSFSRRSLFAADLMLLFIGVDKATETCRCKFSQ